jgi:integrase
MRYERLKTRQIIETALSQWDNFVYHLCSTEQEILEQMKDESKKYLILDHLVQFWKNGRNQRFQKRRPVTVQTYFTFVRAWLQYSGIELQQEKISQFVRFPKSDEQRVRGINRDMIQAMYNNADDFMKALIVFLAATGMRIGEALATRVEWIDFSKTPAKITIPAEYTKTRQERITFLTPEAVKWINRIHPEPTGIIFNVAYKTVWKRFDALRKKCGFTDTGTNGFHHFRIHKYRGFTENRLARTVDPEFAHTILGHKKDLIQYNQGGMTEDDAANDYLKAIPELTIAERTLNQ